MKLARLTAVATLVMFAISLPANASLGGNAASVQADAAHLQMQGKAQIINNGSYTIQEFKAPTGVFREYVSSSGQVFAISWQGSRPDFRQVLGNYYQTYKQAMQTPGVHRGPRVIRQGDLVVEMGGHMRWLVGRAYLKNMIPPQVQLEDIR